MVRRLLALMAFGALLAGGITVATPADATTAVERALDAIKGSRGRYVPGAASLVGSDCSGLVSVAQSIAMGKPIRRLGDTRSLLAGHWPGVIPGASPDDAFVIGVSSAHMVARINGVGIEARQSGEAYRVGSDAASPWSLPRQFHVDPVLLVMT